ncbi:MAG: TIGR00730 family Rossman fold protein [Bacteroidales bacterium]
MINSVCVYSASSTKIPTSYVEAARRLGAELAKANISCINGGSNRGLMHEISKEVIINGGHTIGVIPQFMIDEGWESRELHELIVTDSMHERKAKMIELADAIIALPGGCGTLEELFEAITWKQLGLHSKPIIVVNIDGFYDPLVTLLERAIEQNFMRDVHAKMWLVVATIEEAVQALHSEHDWDSSLRKFAAI